jgi:hypothetical protein
MAELPAQVKKIIDLIIKENQYVDTITDFRKMKLGALYTMVYSPKWSKILPVYDTLPLFMLLGIGSDRLYGINIHYAPWAVRQQLARIIMKMFSWKKRLQYRDIKKAWEASKMPLGLTRLFFRTYLFSHIRSEIKEFHSQNYEMAVSEIMPRFKKKTEEEVYKMIMSQFYKHAGGIKGVTWEKSKKKK